MNLTIRPLAASDSLEALTELLHRAYAALGAQGWNFTAVDQSVELTAKRVAGGGCLLAELEGAGDGVNAPALRLVGTVNVSGPYKLAPGAWGLDTPWYQREDTAILSQYAVDPAYQGRGFGERLMEAAEAWARDRGYAFIALDTAKPAAHLQRRYAQRGYAAKAEVQWEGKCYSSILMVKPLKEAISP